MNLQNTIPIELIHLVTTIIWGLICLLMGITLFFFNIPENETIRTYRTSVRILSINYVVLSVLIIVMVVMNLRNAPDDVFPFHILLMSTSQGLILSYTLVLLYISKEYAWKKIAYYNLIPFSVLIIIYIVFANLLGDPVCNSLTDFFKNIQHFTIFIRFLLLLFNIYQIIFFGILLKTLSLRYKEQVESFYSDTVQLKPQCAKRNCYFALLIGVTSVFSMFIKNTTFDTIFTIVFCIYYFLFALIYMQYKDLFAKLEPEILQELTQYESVEELNKVQQIYGWNWTSMKNQILEQKLYLQPGITVNDMTTLFKTNRTTFSSLLNTNEGQNFNSFINQLRVEHAKQLILEKKEHSIADIAQQCGFTEQSNFTRQFKIHCSETPAVYAKKTTIGV